MCTCNDATQSYIPRLSQSSPSQPVMFPFSCTSALPQNPAMSTSINQPILTHVLRLSDPQAISISFSSFLKAAQMADHHRNLHKFGMVVTQIYKCSSEIWKHFPKTSKFLIVNICGSCRQDGTKCFHTLYSEKHVKILDSNSGSFPQMF